MPGFNALQSRPPAPPTPLGRLRLLSPNAAIRCSPLLFGGISLGTAWHEYQPPTDKEKSFKLLDAYVAAGGNFIDTANGYSDEESETILGEWMNERGNRDRLIVATKYTSDYQSHKYGKNEVTNLCGNSKKSMHVSIKDSLRKLQTDYVDIFYIHFWDHSTSIPELMDSLDILVKQGKVLYLGASDMPAWIVSACNEYAKAHNKAQFVVLQTMWNAMDRTIERDLLPMARHYNMAIIPWSAVGSGRFRNPLQLQEAIDKGDFKGEDDNVKYSRKLFEIGKKRGIESFAPIALAYLFAKYPLVFPIVGFQTPEMLHQNIRALEIKLTPEEIKEIEGSSLHPEVADETDLKPLEHSFPHDMIGDDPRLTGQPGGNIDLQMGTIDWLVDQKVYASQLNL